jgi:hypothetical protein
MGRTWDEFRYICCVSNSKNNGYTLSSAGVGKRHGVTLTKVKNEFHPITLAINVDAPDPVDTVIEQVRKAGSSILREPSSAFDTRSAMIEF